MPSGDGAQWRKRIRFALALPVLLVVVLVMTSLYQVVARRIDAERFPAPGKLVDVGGYRLHIYCTGRRVDNSATVLFEGGLGAASVMWSMVQDGVAPHTRACSYDRAGYGWSDPGPQPRTARQLVTDLHVLLEKAGESPPYILVGHSLGGIIVRLYASTYPHEVAGLVLVDARHEDFFQRMPPSFLTVDEANLQRAELLRIITPLGLTRLVGNAGLLASFEQYLAPLPDQQRAAAIAIMIYSPQHWQTSILEREAIDESYRQVRSTSLPSDLPLTVLAADNGVAAWQPSSAPLDQPTRDTWMALQREMATLTARSKFIIVDRSGHYIQLDRPDAVTNAILDQLPHS